MRKLGISIYPDKSSKEDILCYIHKAKQVGFSRIFSCLLSLEKDVTEIKNDFLEINTFAKENGFEIIVDVSPKVFDKLNISYNDLSFFNDIKADGIRLDLGFTGSEESLMTYNPYNLKIEINMSNDTSYIDTIMKYQPNAYNLIGCHNFYPHRYAGLSLNHFIKCTKNFKTHGLRTAAFVSSQSDNSFGPWAAKEGLPTLEDHRNIPVDTQIKHFIALGIIDDVIISNCYPSTEELNSISKLDLSMITFDIKLVKNIPEVERNIALEELHFNRGDVSDNLIRSTQSRVKYKDHDFKIFNAPPMIKRGDVVIESSLYGHYAGELQIALQDMKNSGKSNVVGSIRKEEFFILDVIKPWQKFRLTMSE